MPDTEAAEYIDPTVEDETEGAAGETNGGKTETASGDNTADKTGDKTGAKTDDKKADDDLRNELASLRARVSEAEDSARYWHSQARGQQHAKPAAKTEDKPQLSVDLVEAITKNDPAAIKKAMGELGFVDQATLNAHVEGARRAVVAEERIYSEFPDLRDNESEFFKATQKHFRELVEDGADSASLATTRAAAKLAAADRGREAERSERIRRQAGERGSRGSSRGRDAEAGADNELDNTQRRIIEGFQRAGATTVTEESYRKRAESGVQMSGVRTRRAR